MSIDTTKCIDLAGAGSSLGNGTHLIVNTCASGRPSQQWSIAADAFSGAFVFKNVAAGRCLDETASNTSSGMPMQIWDCVGASNQKFTVRAY
jgi:glucosylceramidase